MNSDDLSVASESEVGPLAWSWQKAEFVLVNCSSSPSSAWGWRAPRDVHPTDQLLMLYIYIQNKYMLYKYMLYVYLVYLGSSWRIEGGDMHPTNHPLCLYVCIYILYISLALHIGPSWTINKQFLIYGVYIYTYNIDLYTVGPLEQ